MVNKYKIHVINRDLNFDPTYKNVVQFFNISNNTKDYTGVFTSEELNFTPIEEEINFNIIDSINASVTLDINGEFASRQFLLNTNEFLTIEKALNRQYCIIRKYEYTDEEEFINSIDYFYFMKNPRAINENLVKYDLQLDVFTTHPLFSDIDISETKILRAHIDRFTETSRINNATLKLDFPYLETAEPLDDKYLKVNKECLPVEFKTYNSINKIEGSNTLDNDFIISFINSLRWLYIERRETNPNKNLIYFAPIIPAVFKKGNITINNIEICGTSDAPNYLTDTTYTTGFNDANYMYDKFAEDVNVINAFISPFSPFSYINDNTSMSIWYNWHIEEGNTYFKLYFNYVDARSEASKMNVKYYGDIEKSYLTDFKINFTYQFLESFTNKEAHIFQYESKDIVAFTKTFNLGSNTYDYNKIKDAEIKTKIRQCYNKYTLKNQLEAIDIDIDLTYLKTNIIKAQAYADFRETSDGNIFLTLNDLVNKRLGAHLKPKYTPQFYSDKYAEFKAQNHNYAITGVAIPLIQNTFGGAIAGGIKGGAIGAAAGAFAGLATTTIKTIGNLDNMLNTPDSVKRKGESDALDNFINKTPIYIEHETLREQEEKEVTQYFYEFGYTINAIGTIKDYFKRSSFNYIQLENCQKDVHALLSEDILNVVIKALNDGVRFWTKTKYISTKFEYTTNNFESKLFIFN